MLRVRMISGEELAALPVEELSSVRELKRRLHQMHGQPPRFRQRLILQAPIWMMPRVDLGLVVLDFCSASETQAAELVDASKRGRLQKVESMLQLPLDPNVVFAGRTGLSWASQRGRIEVMRLLVEAGADKDKADRENSTALMHAAANGHVKAVRLSVEAGVDKDKADSNGFTALMGAAAMGQVEAVRLLVEAGADKDKADRENSTALMHAAANGHVKAVRLLVEAGVDKDKADSNGFTALMGAAAMGQVEAVRLLVEAGADKDKADSNGYTALAHAARYSPDALSRQ